MCVAALAVAWLPGAGVVSASTILRMQTVLGDVDLQLFDDLTPATAANFMNYVASDAYDGTFFHRSLPGFLVQGGGFTFDPGSSSFQAIPVDPAVVNELGRSNTRGTVAMHTLEGDPDSATSQFFFNLADNGGPPRDLDTQNGGATVFAQVLGSGMAVVDAAAALSTFDLDGPGQSNLNNVPLRGVPGSTADNLVSVTDVLVLAAALTGDMNGSGALDDGDVLAFIDGLTNPASFSDAFLLAAGDVNLDGVFDLSDVEPFAARLQASGVPAAGLLALVPEPSAAAVLVIFTAVCGLRRRIAGMPG